ncbi:MAG: DUF11 domain-containing protein [Dehalococcoidia bacterium]|nr:DUF11 domain-containing protein [Dehalococcoidia bacterium]MDW8119166.1 DUF11 domain-containing protein [Chloroflexota bacterium]
MLWGKQAPVVWAVVALGVLGALPVVAGLTVLAQVGGPYEVRSSVVGAGGGNSTGGPFSLQGTIGQVDAGQMVSGTLEVRGGFWPRVTLPTPTPPPPPPKPSGADLAVFKSASPDPGRVGQSLTYTILVTNAGPGVATGVLLTDTLPSTVNLVSISASQGSCIGVGSVTCNLGNIGAGFSASVTIVVQPTAAGKVSNTVQVWTSTPDPQTSNNQATITTTVNP